MLLLITFLAITILINFVLIYNKTVVNLMSLVLLMILSCIFLFIHQNTEFLMYAYLIVYVGAIMVMFLFVVMTIDVKKENMKGTPFADAAIYVAVGTNGLTSLLFYIMQHGGFELSAQNNVSELKFLKKTIEDTPFSSVFAKVHSNNLSEETEERLWFLDNSGVFGEYLFQKHAVAFIVAAVVLLAGMVVSIIICSVFGDKKNVIKDN